MFPYRFFYIPDTVKPVRECNKVSRAKADTLSLFGLYSYIAFQDIAHLRRVIMPIETGNLFCPNRPRRHAHFLKFLCWNLFNLNIHFFSPLSKERGHLWDCVRNRPLLFEIVRCNGGPLALCLKDKVREFADCPVPAGFLCYIMTVLFNVFHSVRHSDCKAHAL